MKKPLDHPTPDRPHRIYFALTNHCNRACPWCSTCSSPRGQTWLTLENYVARLPESGLFQVQLEGGEPTLHPQFWDFVRIAREHPRCTELVVCTNGVVLARRREKLLAWLGALGAPLTIKISVNHHLLERDPRHLELVRLLCDLMQELGGARLLVVNVRLRRGTPDEDQWVKDAVERAGLLAHSNVFFLQRYGFAADEPSWDPPSPVWSNFSLVNPDGKLYGPDLVRRSEGMRVLK